MVISKLDDIAWLLNLRGNDIDYNPLFKSYLFIYMKENSDKTLLFTLYVNQKKVTP